MPLHPFIRSHRLPGNKNERSPYDVAFIDTESHWGPDGENELHVLRLWSGEHVRRRAGKSWPARDQAGSGRTAEELAAWLESCCVSTHPLHVYAHNLSFDLALTRLPLVMIERGWELGQQCLASEAPWANLRRGSHSIWLLDSHSWLREPLEEIGRRIGMSKPSLPDEDDSEAAWFTRCAADVAITRAAMLQLLDWWDAEKLGHWSRTGPQTGWNCLRHMCCNSDSAAYKAGRLRVQGGEIDLHPGRIEICEEPGVRAFERAALYQGLREVSRTGHLEPGVWANLDLKQAHLRVAASKMLPCRLVDQGDSLELDSRFLTSRLHDVIAEVTLRTEAARYPRRLGGRVLHPTGEFRTILCGPEIRRALQRGEVVAIGRWQGYALNHFSQPWARWLLDLLEAPAEDVPPAVRIACKGWSRTVIGKWGARTSRTEKIGTVAQAGWSVVPALASEGAPVPALVKIGHDLFDVIQDQEGDNAFPAVLAFIQSHVRLQLLDAIDAVGAANVVQANTDGFLVDAVGAGMIPLPPASEMAPLPATWSGIDRCCAMLSEQLEGAEIALKGLYTRIWVGSPQHLELDGWRRMAGVPGRLEERRGLRFEFLTWPKLAGQMRGGSEHGYLRKRAVRDLSHLPVPGWVTESGRVLPVRLRLGVGGEAVVVAAEGFKTERGVEMLRAEQAPFLARLVASQGEAQPPGG